MKAGILAFALLIGLTSVFGIPEDSYSQRWEEEVFPFFMHNLDESYFESRHNGVRIHFGFVRSEPTNDNGKIIVITTGRSEPFYKYAEVVYDLYSEGYSFALLDHRGQGGSDRELDNPQKGHVKSFKHYRDDLQDFIVNHVALEKKEIYLIGHSMGAFAASMMMVDKPALIKKAVLSSPMLKPFTDPYPGSVALAYAGALKVLGKGEEYAPGKGDYEEDQFEGNTVTHSLSRFEMNQTLLNLYPDYRLGGVTVDWVFTALNQGNLFVHKYRKVKTPILLFEAGADTIVNTKRYSKFCRRVKSCESYTFPTGKHELLMEEDAIRDQIIAKIKKFFR